jgi:hypothetical protein
MKHVTPYTKALLLKIAITLPIFSAFCPHVFAQPQPIPEARIFRVNWSQGAVALSLSAYQARYRQAYVTTLQPGAAVGGPHLYRCPRTNIGQTEYFIVVLTNSDIPDLGALGVVVRARDLYIQGYIPSIDTNNVQNNTFYRYTDAFVTQQQMQDAGRTIDLRTNTQYGEGDVIITRQTVINTVRNIQQDVTHVDSATGRVMAPFLAESVRFAPTLRDMIGVLGPNGVGFDFQNRKQVYFNNWQPFSNEEYTLAQRPDLTADETRRYLFLLGLIIVAIIPKGL